MDLITYLPATNCSCIAIYTVIDKLSKFTYFIPCKHTASAAEFSQLFLENMVAHNGMPASIVSDHDPQFTSHFWHSLISTLDCKHSLSTAFYPETDGVSKRMHRSTEQFLCCYVSAQQGNWDLLLPMYEFTLNSTRSASTGLSTACTMFGYKPTLSLEDAVHAVTDGPVQSATDCIAKIESTLQLVHSDVTHSAAYMADYANQHLYEVTFAVYSDAWLSTVHLKLHITLSQKLASCYVVPFKIIEQINPVAFHLLLPNSWKVHDVFRIIQLNPAIGFVPGLSGVTPFAFWPPVDDSGEFKVKDILESHFVGHGCQLVEEFLIKQHRYDLFKLFGSRL